MKTNILMLIIAVCSLSAIAQEQVSVVNTSESKDVEISKGTRTSIDNRKDKKAEVTIGFGINNSVWTKTITVGTFLKPNDLIELSYIKGGVELDSKSGTYTLINFKYEMNAVQLSYKKFVGNSFYFSPSVYHVTRTVSTGFFNNSLKGTAKYSELAAAIKIGNQWQYDNFTIGCDWFGINRDVMALGRKTENVTIDTNSDSFTLLNFYLGATF